MWFGSFSFARRTAPSHTPCRTLPVNELKNAGYTSPFYSLEDGVADYVRQYLLRPDIYR